MVRTDTAQEGSSETEVALEEGLALGQAECGAQPSQGAGVGWGLPQGPDTKASGATYG